MIENKRTITDTFFLIILQGLNYAMPMLVFPYLIVTLGAAKFGYIGFSTAVVQYLMLIVDFGFNFTATKQIALVKDDKNKLNKIFTSTLYSKFQLLLISFFILLIISLIPKFVIYRSTLWIMSIMILGNTFSFVWLFHGLGRIKLVSIFTSIAKLTVLPLTFIFVKTPDDYNIAAFLQALVIVVSVAITVVFIVKNRMARIVKVTKYDISASIKNSFPLFLSTLASAVYVSLFVVVLGYFTSPDDVGKYVFADKMLRMGCYLILVPVIQIFYPKISIMSKKPQNDAKKLIRKILVIVSVLMLILGIMAFIFIKDFLVFFDRGYDGIDVIVRILAIVPLFIAVGGILGQLGLLAFGNKKDERNFRNTYFITSLIAIICMVTLIPFFHVIGAAISLLIVEFCVAVFMVIFSRKIFFN